MKAIEALFELLSRVGACRGKAVLVTDEELLQWPKVAVKAMKSQKMIIKARPASSAICSGCENNCVMPVNFPSVTTGEHLPFIVCDKRNDINRVLVSTESLLQWQCNTDLISGFISSSLGLRNRGRHTDGTNRQEIGMVIGDKRSQMICLEASGTINIIVGNSKVPLVECVEFQKGEYTLDVATIRRFADATTTADNRYTPNNARREVHKLDTQAKYESWRKAYREWLKKRPGMSDVWYSQQIAKMDIAQGRDEETIRKKMKR